MSAFLSTPPATDGAGRARPRTLRFRRFAAVLIALPLPLAACGDGPGTEEDLVNALTREDTFTTDEARCIAGAVFDQYGADEQAIGRISAASDFATLSGENGVEGFAESYDRILSACTGS